ncbi:cyclic nucleotide-binding domain-containing protein [archaeon]|nr:MAG: cyclic nucleotide-binding domain-containing protein [archaeon]
MEFLRNVTILNKRLGEMMTEAELEKMTVSLERETYENGEVIVRQGNTGDHFYILAEGSVGVFRSDDGGPEKKLTTLHQGGYFGEKALLKEDVRQASCIAEGHVVVLTLGREDFIDMLGTVEELIDTNKNSKDALPTASMTALPILEEHKDEGFLLSLTLQDLEVKATLGCGAFGRVKLCRLPKGDQYYALKCQAKKSITESGLQEHVLNEMRVMKKIRHPFICQLFAALQDKFNIYFVLELLQGGELFTHLRNRGKLSEQAARFYAATVVYAFSTIHAKKIAYRDLKPENLVMDNKGYVKLVDFGLAKQLLAGKTW